MSQPNLKTDADVVALQPEVGKLTTFANSLVIKTQEGYAVAGRYLTTVKGLLKKIEDARTRVTKPLLEAQRELNAQANEAKAPLLEAETLIKRSMSAYTDEQLRLQREEQRKRDEAARKEREKLAEQARRAEATGKPEKAAALEQRAEAVVAPVIYRAPPKVSGIVTREVWKYEIVDASALPREYTMPDDTRIGGVVRSMKGDTNITGVRVWSENQIAAGAA